MSSAPKPVILLAGPTASGKTGLSIALARVLDGEIINADSMQIYADLKILSARPGEDEQAGIPHHLFGVLDAGERASTGWWARAAMDAIADIRARGNRPIIVGGTGLYFEALTQGLAVMPEISPATRAKADAVEADGGDALRIAADQHDPEATAKIKPNDNQRLRRIVEIGIETGRPISEFQSETRPMLAASDWTGLVIDLDRDLLYERIEQRFDAMMAAGALDEARALAARGLEASLPSMKAIGVPPLIAASQCLIKLEDAIARAKQDSRRYAKRQLTWFRNRMTDWPRITLQNGQIDTEDVISRIG
ncbi:tRNA (adenosine(37)-N6)-dimethylallyltransferase MiaA [Hyphobacterium sp. HN65]|uniref:tRNA dimethylallyltransferase n=1 Tax=Hyphobacterium lacteum TaxID=3116575 RepID=A0ABU7LQT9_9PROT|nr:tRNA (adenosine(37)-N6)-dimethylallyltransferase MiaA [Hyphobacterium sp. HN65]MEE2526273.1 tRNA (adenosine(37)-N6)-dimethylallyltransferase MiaA [Hyphobacterium sp. HN65]